MRVIVFVVVVCGVPNFILGNSTHSLISGPQEPLESSKRVPNDKLSVSNVTSDGVKIVGGTEAEANQFPFLVSLQASKGPSGRFRHVCGGSIYNDKYIITAAHCVSVDGLLSEILLRIVAGEHDLSAVSDNEQIQLVKAITIHPSYRPYNLENDIAVLELESSLIFNQYVAPIKIASTNPAVNSHVTVSGWGKERYFASTAAVKTRKASVRVFSNAYCSLLNGIRRVTSTMLCAGVYFPITGGRDACQGDSGGPLFTETEPRQLIGVVSWGIGCAFLLYPGVYTRVPSFNKFITDVAGSGA